MLRVQLADAGNPRRFATSRSAALSGRFTSLIILAALLAGCGGNGDRVPVYPVKGKVTVFGEVPEGALVILNPVKDGGETEIRPSGKVRSDGTFSVTTYDADDGAPAGEYLGTIQWNKLVQNGRDWKAGPNVVPKDYASRQTSPWKITVEAAPKELEPLAIAK
ncbi:hypothetical protein [Singulisphaera sp. PoT]|uniref:hypothetical protein n=1 Tax=Singulisphaera sp. PoT TaxID=3411797 RepID=UPI003BF4C919